MANKQKPCTLSTKHKWEHVKDRTLVSQTMSTTSFRRVGVYKCKCGATRAGQAKSGL